MATLYSYANKLLYIISAHLPTISILQAVPWDSDLVVADVLMMTSSNGNISVLLDICAGNSPVPGEFLAQRPVTRTFDVFFDLHLNRRLSKQSWGWGYEMLSCLLWRHCNVNSIILLPEIPLPWHQYSTYVVIYVNTLAYRYFWHPHAAYFVARSRYLGQRKFHTIYTPFCLWLLLSPMLK